MCNLYAFTVAYSPEGDSFCHQLVRQQSTVHLCSFTKDNTHIRCERSYPLHAVTSQPQLSHWIINKGELRIAEATVATKEAASSICRKTGALIKVRFHLATHCDAYR